MTRVKGQLSLWLLDGSPKYLSFSGLFFLNFCYQKCKKKIIRNTVRQIIRTRRAISCSYGEKITQMGIKIANIASFVKFTNDFEFENEKSFKQTELRDRLWITDDQISSLELPAQIS